MNKIIKNLVSALTITFFFLLVFSPPLSTKASESSSLTLNDISSDLDPLILKYFKDKGATEVVSHKNEYYKVTLKDPSKSVNRKSLTINDYKFEKTTKYEYNMSKIRSKVTNSPALLSGDDGVWDESDSDGVVNIGVTFVRNPDNLNLFSSSISFGWSRNPIINTTDALGFRVSPTMTIIKDSCWAHAQGTLDMPGDQTYYENILKTGNLVYQQQGAGYEISPKAAYSTNTGFMIADITFSQIDAGRQYGSIYGYYIRSSLGANLSIDYSGKPSIGFEATNSLIETGATVNNFQ